MTRISSEWWLKAAGRGIADWQLVGVEGRGGGGRGKLLVVCWHLCRMGDDVEKRRNHRIFVTPKSSYEHMDTRDSLGNESSLKLFHKWLQKAFITKPL